MAFDPQPYLIHLPRKVKDKATGHYTTVYDDYLEVKWRLCWFRDRYPHGVITTEEVCVDLERGYARYRAVVEDGEGGKATGYGTETAADFGDYCERAETRALGRALAALGIGTQFVGMDLTEGAHVADAPVRTTTVEPSNGNHAGAPVVENATAVVGCLGATEHKTGLRKALDPKVPNHIPFCTSPTTDNDRSQPAPNENLRTGLETKNQQLRSELRASPSS
jgi:hypothetical protein